MREFILASASPRRREILQNAGFSFRVVPSDADETVDEGISGEKTVEILAERKALQILGENPDAVILGCDTVVVSQGRILGKPRDDSDAFSMLRELSGKTHSVCTGVCICDKDRRVTFCNTTKVTFNSLSDETIRSYIATGEPGDKAGSYGIQGFGSVLVKNIQGDYFSVMGLPVCESASVLADFGIFGRVKL